MNSQLPDLEKAKGGPPAAFRGNTAKPTLCVLLASRVVRLYTQFVVPCYGSSWKLIQKLIVLTFTFRPMIHFELIFIDVKR